MLIRNTKAAAEKIAADYSDTGEIDVLALNNSLLIYITDRKGSILYSTDSYRGNYIQKEQADHNGSENPYLKNEEMEYLQARYRSLPDGYDAFLAELAQSDGTIENIDGTQYIYGQYLDDDTVLYLNVTLEPIGAAAKIIHVQLLIVTVISLLLAVLLAFLISRRFAKPIAAISGHAEQLGEEAFDLSGENGFCREIDKLAETLADTNRKLCKAKDYQRELLANISHDLRTPLTMIRGYAESIRDFDEEEKQRIEDADIIIRESERLNALVNDILEYSELHSNDGEIKFNAVDMQKLVSKVIAQFEPLFQAEGGSIQKNLMPGLTVRGNARQLERAVYNLLDNAIRHTKEDRRIETALYRREYFVRLEVTDHGNGIPKEQLLHIWERYYTYRQRDQQGVSGLGLAIVRQIVALHNGKCGVDTREGIGSTFWIEFPLLKPDADIA